MKFTEAHDWISIEGTTATIGITSFAQKELGEIMYVELPNIGYQVEAGDPVVVLESTKAAVDIYTPLSGEVIGVNTTLKDNPDKINTAAESEGWLYKLRLQKLPSPESLMDQDAYTRYILGK